MSEHAPIRQMVTKCDGCGASIIFVKTAAGEARGETTWIPIDAKPERRMVINAEQLAESVTTWTPHHAVCPEADRFRK